MRFIRLPFNHIALLTAAVWLPTLCVPLLMHEVIDQKRMKWDNSEDIRAMVCISLLAIFSPVFWVVMGLFYVSKDRWTADNKWSKTKFVCMYRELFVTGRRWIWNFDDIDGDTNAARDNMVELISKATRRKFKRGGW